MASSSPFSSLGSRLLVKCCTHQTDLPSHPPDHLGFPHNSPRTSPPLPPVTLVSPAPCDRRQDLHSRPSNRAGSFGAVIAATAVAGLSLVSAASLAMVSDLNDSLLASSTLLPSPEPSLSMAIPIAQQEVWVFSQNGFLAPLPHTPSDGFIVPFPNPEKDAALQDSDLRCPPWTPMEFEMVLPDFQGRPKPFPRRGYYWSATFVVKGMDKAFLQAAFLEDGLAFAESEASTRSSEESEQVVVKEMGQEEREGNFSLPKALALLGVGKRFTCFSL